MFTWFKRFFLFAAVNMAVVLTISILLQLLGIKPYQTIYGIDYYSLLAFCLVWGMGGAMFSLATSRIMAKMMMGVEVIDPQTHDSQLQDLVQTVHQLARSAGLPAMPEVGIYQSPEINAFATGPTKSRALVAVSTGLLNRMNRAEVEGVLSHEIAHVANGDMVTMTLIQGVVNAFVMFFSRVLAFFIAQALRGDRDDRDRGFAGSGIQFMVQFVLEIVFMILGTMIVAAFSRWREFRADAGGARLAGSDRMIAALQALQRVYERNEEVAEAQPAIQSLKISGRAGGFLALFSTHPPLEERILRLQTGR